MPRLPSFILIAIAVAGCATTPASAPKDVSRHGITAYYFVTPGPDKTPVTLTRDAGPMGSMCDIHVFVRGVSLTKLSSRERVTLQLEDGSYVISARTRGLCGGETRETMAEVRGRPLAFRVGFGANGDLFISPTN